jgi:hypothetical protein
MAGKAGEKLVIESGEPTVSNERALSLGWVCARWSCLMWPFGLGGERGYFVNWCRRLPDLATDAPNLIRRQSPQLVSRALQDT